MLGKGANLSITTFLGGGAKRLPEIVINFCPTDAGAFGGASRTTNGAGVAGLGGTYILKFILKEF